MKAKYREYHRKVLEFLVTKTDDGSASVSALRDYGRIPKSSMTNVVAEMKANGLVETKKWFNKQKIVYLTGEGRKQYLDILVKPGEYAIPYSVKNYLDQREPRIERFFPVQQDFVDRGLLLSKDNVCAFAYPGTGKTLLAEMAMTEAIANGGRALYCTPYKALDWQKYEEFRKSFSNLGIEVAVTDGDNPVTFGELNGAKLVIGTYERVAGALRRNEQWLSAISLVCADEITLLAEQYRGSTIDLMLTLMKRRQNLRIITLSSIVGNPLAISSWLGAKPLIANIPLPEMRVEESVVFQSGGELVFLFRDGREKREQTVDAPIEHLVKANIGLGKTSLIFVGPRDDAVKWAQRLKSLHKQSEELTRLVQEFEQSPFVEATSLTRQTCELLKFGIAFHHAGLHKRVRRFIESLLTKGKLNTIVATGTLSHGVDFKIDSVIMDLGSIGRAYLLHRYEYINYKGRAGRPGKSDSASVYLVSEKWDTSPVFSKYFFHSPEDILPKTVLMYEELATMALAVAAPKGSVSIEELTDVVMSTLSAESLVPKRLPLSRLLLWLQKNNFVEKSDERYLLTSLGKKVNESNISPIDALKISGLSMNPSKTELISLAVAIDLVKNFRKTSARKKDPTEMLLDWIEETPIDRIKEKYNGYWDDGDILLLGEYSAISLDKIFTFVSARNLRGVELLKERLKCGVKQDVVKAEFTKLPLVTRNKARSLARALRNAGYSNLKQLSTEDPLRLAGRLSVTASQAVSIIEDARSAIHL